MSKKIVDSRDAFLLQMYNQLFNDINRHILISWQSFGTLIGTISLLTLTNRGLLSLNYTTCGIIIICSWLIANIYDASYWYNRKLAIITNIEKQFLKISDLTEIHYYFGKHRPKNKMITYFRIQFYFSIFIAASILSYQFVNQISDTFFFSIDLGDLSFEKLYPYLISIISIVILNNLRIHRNKSYQEFLQNSPGLQINSDEINYGIGHGFNKIKITKNKLTNGDKK